MRKPNQEFIKRMINLLVKGIGEFSIPKNTIKKTLVAITRSNTIPNNIKNKAYDALMKMRTFHYSIFELKESLKTLLE